MPPAISKDPATVNDEANTNLKTGQTAYFKDPQNEFLVTVKQNSGADATCVNVKIDREGTGRQTAPYLPSGGFVSNKTFLITADNGGGSFDLTLYYSKAEMAVWGAGTSSLNILKSAGSIASATVANSSALCARRWGPISRFWSRHTAAFPRATRSASERASSNWASTGRMFKAPAGAAAFARPTSATRPLPARRPLCLQRGG